MAKPVSKADPDAPIILERYSRSEKTHAFAADPDAPIIVQLPMASLSVEEPERIMVAIPGATYDD
jgi:hypothetical protein